MTGAITRLAIGAGALLLTACNPVANLHHGDAAIERFHQLYSSGNVDALYGLTGPTFHKVTNREQFGQLIAVLDARLGRVTSSERQGFKVNSTPAGTFTFVAMNTKFEQGTGVETFTFLGNGDDMKLEGYHVDSDRLMITPEDLAHEQQNQAITVSATK